MRRAAPQPGVRWRRWLCVALALAACCLAQPLLLTHIRRSAPRPMAPCSLPPPDVAEGLPFGVSVVVPVPCAASRRRLPTLLAALQRLVALRPLEVRVASPSPVTLPAPNSTAPFPVSVGHYPQDGRGTDDDRWEQLANCAASQAVYSHLLFLSPLVALQNDVASATTAALLQNTSLGVAGCHVVTADPGGLPERNGPSSGTVLSHGYDIALLHFRAPVIVPRLRGYSARDTRLQETQVTVAVSHFCFAVRTALFAEMGGLDPSVKHDLALRPSDGAVELRHQLPVFDLCFRTRYGGHWTVVTAGAVALDPKADYGGAAGVLAADEDVVWEPRDRRRWPRGIGHRADVWTGFLWRTFHRTSIDGQPWPVLQVLWQLPVGPKCTGFGNEAVHFAVPLEADGHYAVRLWNARAEEFCPGWPTFMQRAIQRLTSGRGFGALVHWQRDNPVQVLVLHGLPIVAPPTLVAQARPDYIVARSMYEYTLFPPECLFQCEGRSFVDEVWVPSRHAFDVFLNSGVPAAMLRVVPEPVDTFFYDPTVTVPLDFPADLAQLGWNSSDRAEEGAKPSDAERQVRRGHFKFLSLFKLEARKGWDAMLEAFAAEFRPDEPVSLYVFTRDHEATRTPAEIWQIFSRHVAAKCNVTAMPHVEVVTVVAPEAVVPRIYRSVDAFVLPARAEGWGLPIIQAMAMGLPTVATGWSGQVDFMTNSTSYLVDYTLEPVPPQGRPKVPGSLWASPSVPHLRRLLRHVYANRAEAQARGRAARQHVVAHFSEAVVLKEVKRRLDVIKAGVLARRAVLTTHRGIPAK